MNKFKKGDKVKVVVGNRNIPLGSIWEVKQSVYDYDDGDEFLALVGCKLTEDAAGWSASRFELVRDSEKESDAVHSPKHYAVFDDIEAIEVIARSMTKEMFKGYCFGNLLKYRLRVGGKDEVMQELGKADKYKELYEKFKGLCQ